MDLDQADSKIKLLQKENQKLKTDLQTLKDN